MAGSLPAPDAFDEPKARPRVERLVASTKFVVADPVTKIELRAPVHRLIGLQTRRRQLLGRGVGAVAAAVVGAGAAVALVGSSDGLRRCRLAPRCRRRSDPAFVVGKPPKLNARPHERVGLGRAAPRSLAGHRQPSAAAVARVPALTPEGTGNIVQVLGRKRASPDGSGSTSACRRAPRASTDGCRARR